MVGLVLVSHSRTLAAAVRELVISMSGPKLSIAIAAGVASSISVLVTMPTARLCRLASFAIGSTFGSSKGLAVRSA